MHRTLKVIFQNVTGTVLEVNESKASMYWNQETADHMWIGFRDRDNCQVMRNLNLMSSEAKQYTYLAAGHPKGWNDALKNNIYNFYKHIDSGKDPQKYPCDFATFKDSHYILALTEAILRSNKTRAWVEIN